MRFVLVGVLTALVGADEACEQPEQVSMLQTKDRATLAKEPVDLIQAVNVASETLNKDSQMESFLNEVKLAAKAMSEAEGKEILLQRASQSDKMNDLIGQFHALSGDDQDKLVAAGGNILEKLPTAQKSALVQQVSHAMDETLGAKPQTRTEKTAEGKSTITRDDRTGYYHRHYHGRRGTESASVGKRGGHRHFHSYRHNGQGGNARTATASTGLTGHEHSHTHAHSLNNGVTNTATATRTRGSNGHVHEHGHTHAHQVDGGTGTGTFTRTNNQVHTHDHSHNEQNGNSHTNSNSWDNGIRTWHHGHDHDARSGVWHSEGNGHGHHGGSHHHDWDDHDNHDHR